MNPANTAILFNILLFVLYVLVPLIPAILIYKIFPGTTVGANGFLGNLKINATGAFAAYLIVALIGYFIVHNTQQLINSFDADNTSWVVKSNIVFMDHNGTDWNRSKRINDDSILQKLEIKSTPDYNQKNSAGIMFMMYYKDGLSRVTFSYPGYESQVKEIIKDSVKFDYVNRKIDLGKIELRQVTQTYNPSQFPQPMPNNIQEIPDFTSVKPPK